MLVNTLTFALYQITANPLKTTLYQFVYKYKVYLREIRNNTFYQGHKFNIFWEV